MTDQRIPQDVLEKEAVEIPAVADRLRLRALDRRQALNRARDRRRALELARRQAQDEDLAPAAAAFLAQRRESVRLQTEIRQAEIGQTMVEPEPGQWVVTGRLLDPRGLPADGLEVLLSDERGPEKPIGQTQSDGGIYLIQVPKKAAYTYFKGSKQLAVTVRGGPHEVLHTVVRDLGDREQGLRVVNVRLPKEALGAGASGSKGDGEDVVQQKPPEKPVEKKPVKKKPVRKKPVRKTQSGKTGGAAKAKKPGPRKPVRRRKKPDEES